MAQVLSRCALAFEKKPFLATNKEAARARKNWASATFIIDFSAVVDCVSPSGPGGLARQSRCFSSGQILLIAAPGWSVCAINLVLSSIQISVSA